MEENEALILLKMCKTLARRLTFEDGQTNVRLTRGDLTNLRGFSIVLTNIPLPRRPHLMQESGLTEVEQTSLLRMLGVTINREKAGVDVATGLVVSHRHKIKSYRKTIMFLPSVRID
jgi:hypothetical protein